MDIEEQMAADEQAMNRLASAAERIADALEMWCKIQSQRFDKEYPVKPHVRDVDIHTVPSDLERLKQDQGASDEPITEWIGLREQEFIEQGSETSASRRHPRIEKKRSRSTPA